MALEQLAHLIDLDRHPITDQDFIQGMKATLDQDGVVTLPGFLTETALAEMIHAAEAEQHQAFFTQGTHNVYLTPSDETLPKTHAFNRQVSSSKGCITTDQVPPSCGLHDIYHAEEFQDFIADVVGEPAIHPYADPLSSINIHYASAGQELGWHFDNSSFAITLLLQAPEDGGAFEYVKDLRDADRGEMNFDGVDAVLDGAVAPEILTMAPGTLVLFRGRNAMHRVTPTIGNRTRYLVVLAYNSQPGIALSENARMTFYGRLG